MAGVGGVGLSALLLTLPRLPRDRATATRGGFDSCVAATLRDGGLIRSWWRFACTCARVRGSSAIRDAPTGTAALAGLRENEPCMFLSTLYGQWVLPGLWGSTLTGLTWLRTAPRWAAILTR